MVLLGLYVIWTGMALSSISLEGVTLLCSKFLLSLGTDWCFCISGWGVGFSCQGQSSLQASGSHNGRGLG